MLIENWYSRKVASIGTAVLEGSKKLSRQDGKKLLEGREHKRRDGDATAGENERAEMHRG